jgi:hypothetical protein
MAKQIINIGNQSNDGTGDSIRDAFNKVNNNFSDLYNVAGLGQGLSFLSLREAINSNFAGGFSATSVLAISTSGYKIVQSALVAGTGMNITIVDGQIKITNTSSSLINDGSPTLGGYLSGQGVYRGVHFSDPQHDQDTVTRKWVYDNFLDRRGRTIYDSSPDAGTPITYTGTNGSVLLNNIYSGSPNNPNTATNSLHLVNKDYADSKIAIAGVSAFDPATGTINPALGTMTGPLVLARDPVTQDDITYQGLIAATKHYVDNASFVSQANFYVALNGRDNRTDIPSYKKGRALAYAFRSINQAAQAAMQQLSIAQVVLGVYQKTVTTNNLLTPVTITNTSPSAYTSTATRVTVAYNGSNGTDPFSSGALFPGNYLLGASSGAIGLIEKIGTTSTPTTLEHYDVVLVDYGQTVTSDLINTTGLTTGTVTFTFVTPNLVNIPSYWLGYIFNVDSSIGGGEGIITNIGYYTDPATLNVYDQITVNFYKPVANLNNIPGTLWHVYSNYFQVGEQLKFGQYQPIDQITILVESGEYHENYPIKIGNNVSVKGDEFRRSIIKPGIFVDGSLPTISVSPYATTYFRRDTQVDGILIAPLNTVTNYSIGDTYVFSNGYGSAQSASYTLYETPSSISPGSDGLITISVTATISSNLGVTYYPNLNPAWVGKVFQGNGGQGIIKSVLGNAFTIIPAQNGTYQNQLTSTSTQIGSSWAIYDPVNYGYHYLRNPQLPINQIINNQPGNFLNAVSLLQLNKPYIQSEINSYLTATFQSFVFNTATCKRDTGIIVDSIVQDLLFTTSSQSTYSGLQYWARNGYTGLVGRELTTLTNTINYIKTLVAKVVQNDLSGARYQSAITQATIRPTATSTEVNTLNADFNAVTEIINFGTLNGQAVTGQIIPNGLTTSSTAAVWNAYNSIQDNKTYLQAEATAYLNSVAPSISFSDINFSTLISSISIDLLYGGNRQAVQAGGYYYDFSSSNSNVVGESTQTIAAFNRIRSILPSIATGLPVASYQSVYTQVTPANSLALTGTAINAGSTLAASTAQAKVDIITNIIQNGPSVVLNKTPLPLTASTDYFTTSTAYLIHANRNFIKEDVVQYINAQYGSGFTFDAGKSYRDVGTIIDAICQDLNVGNVANSLTAADYLRNNAFITTSSQCLAAIGYISVLADRILQNIPTGNGSGIYSYQQTAKQYTTSTYELDIAVVTATIGYYISTSSISIVNGGAGYQNGTSLTFVGGGYDTPATANPIIDGITGAITGVTFTSTGSGYTSAPRILITPFGTQPSSTASITVSLMPTGSIKPNLKLVQGGRNYYSTPSAIVVGDGVGASITLSTATVGLYQSVTTATLVSGGSGYTKAYVAIEGGANNSIYYLKQLISGIVQVAGGDPTFNPPKYNDQMDVFLMNDSTILRYISGQGHGGFMKVLDPEGQILAKSPYTQTASSFSKSYNRHVFSGGFLVDGFAGNLLCTPATASYPASLTNGNYPNAIPDLETGLPVQIPVYGLFRRPQTPTFFRNNGIRYQIDYVSQFQQTPNTSTYQCILNLDPAQPGGVNVVNVSATNNNTGFKASSTLTVAFGAPTYPGGIAATGKIQTDSLGNPQGPITVSNGGITFPGVGYVGTPTVILGGGVIGWNITPNGNIDINNISIVNAGSGYVTGCVVNFSTATVKAQATIIATGTNGSIWGFNFSNTGTGYSAAPSYTFGNGFQSSVSVVNGYLGNLPSQIELVTAGNRSMLANDFTQLNDLGYGIFATNGAFIENVSMFTYYCYTSYYCLNGSQVRTITGSSAYGTYGLVSEGSDPSEIPISVTTINDTSQIVTFTQNPGTGSYNQVGAATVYAQFSTPPLNGGYLEVNHRGYRQLYPVVTCSPLTGSSYPSNYYAINLNTTAATWYETQSTSTAITGVYRIGTIQALNGFNPSVLTRTSVNLNLNEDPTYDYKLSSWTYQNNNNTLVTSLISYDYITAQPWQESGYYRQGAYNITGISNATPYSSGTVVTLTFRSPTTITGTVSQSTTATSQNVFYMTTASVSGPVHVGMIATGGTLGVGNRVAYVSTDSSQIYMSNSFVSLTSSTNITFSGTATVATGVANATGQITSLTITESGYGYGLTTNTPTKDGSGGSVAPTASSGNLTATGSSVAGLQGSTVIKISQLKPGWSSRIVSGLNAATPYYYVFGYDGYLFKITAYASASSLGQAWDQLTIQKIDQNGNSISTGLGGNGLPSEMMSNTLYLGAMKGQAGGITQRISTLRATSHDMVNIGTGGYSDSKIPNDLYGPPLNPVKQGNQVIEKSRGRVYSVTTDQDGTFVVGQSGANYLFSVDQAHATISLNATVSQGPQPSLQLQVGPKINAISNDPSMGGVSGAQDTLITQYAVNQFLAIRLGTDNAGNKIAASNLLGPGYIDRTGQQGMIANLSLGGHNINNLSDPALNNPQDASTKGYTDNKISLQGTYTIYQSSVFGALANQGKMTGPLWANAEPVPTENGLVIPPKSYVDKIQQLAYMSDVILTATNIALPGPANLDLLMFTGVTAAYNTNTNNKPIWNTSTYATNVTLNTTSATNTTATSSGGSDINFARVNNTLTIKLNGGVASGLYAGASDYYNPITDYHVNSQAQIRQYKLFMTTATTTATPPAGTQQQIQAWNGVASFDASQFTLTNGWVSHQTSTSITTGIPLEALRMAPANAESTRLKGGLIGSTGTTLTSSTYLSSGTVANFIQAITQDGSRTLFGNLLPASQNAVNLGSPSAEYNTIYSYSFNGTATQASKLLSGLSAETYVSASTSTVLGTIVQRNNDAYINGKFVVDDGQAIVPAYNSGTNTGSTLGLSSRAFTNAYVSSYTSLSNGSTISGANWFINGTIANAPGASSYIGTSQNPITTIRATTGLFTSVGNSSSPGDMTIYGKLDASFITGQTGMWASTTRPGPTILYVADQDTAYQVKGSYNNSSLNNPYIYLQGYNAGTLLTGAKGSVKVDYAGWSDNATTAINANTLQVEGGSYRNAVIDATNAPTYNSFNNTIAARSANGYLYASYFNSADDTSTVAAVSGVMVKKGDNFHRTASANQVATFLSGASVSSLAGSLSVGNSIQFTTGSAFNGTANSTIDTIQDIRTTASPTFNGLTFTNGGILNPSANSSLRQLLFAPESGVGNAINGQVVFTVENLSAGQNGQASVYVRADNTGGKIQLLGASSNASAVVSGMAGLYGTSPNGMFLWENSSCLMQFLASGTGAASAYSGRSPDSVAQLTINGSWDHANAYNQATVTINGGLGVSGDIRSGADMYATTFHGNATSANYADLAEKYLPDAEYTPGTVLIFGGDKEVTLSTLANDRKVAGVISTNPGHMMNSGLEGGVYIALTGRVPCRVIGTIKKGDLMVTSDIPGVAMVNNDPKMGTVIGKALEDYDSQEVGLIEVVVGRV